MKKYQRTNTNMSGLFLLAMVAMVFGASAGPAYAQAGDNVLAKLNLAPQEAKESVVQTLADGGIPYSDAAYKAFKTLPGMARETIVRASLAWIKSYAASAEFKAAYGKLREQEKPQAPEARLSADDEMKKIKAEMEKNIAEMRQNMASMDAEMKKQMEAVIKELRSQTERMEKDPQQKEMMRQGTAMAVEEDKKRYEEDLKEWEQRYPADPRALIKRRISEFLAASAGIDYAAKLVPRGDKMVFASDAYEQKPPEWKLCFRAGKEASEAARSFAQAWLAEMNRN